MPLRAEFSAMWKTAFIVKKKGEILIPQNKRYEVSLDKEISYMLQHA